MCGHTLFIFKVNSVWAQRFQRNRNIYPLTAAESLAYIQAAVLLMGLNCCPLWPWDRASVWVITHRDFKTETKVWCIKPSRSREDTHDAQWKYPSKLEYYWHALRTLGHGPNWSYPWPFITHSLCNQLFIGQGIGWSGQPADSRKAILSAVWLCFNVTYEKERDARNMVHTRGCI